MSNRNINIIKISSKTYKTLIPPGYNHSITNLKIYNKSPIIDNKNYNLKIKTLSSNSIK